VYPIPAPRVRTLNADGWRLFATRCIRLFAYGFLSVVLVLYIKAIGLNDQRVGLLLTLIARRQRVPQVLSSKDTEPAE